MTDDMTDEEFLSYVAIHCETDLALFHRDHANRLLRLAGLPERSHLPVFVGIRKHTALPLVERARSIIAAHPKEP